MGKQPGSADCSALRSRGRAAGTIGTSSEPRLTQPEEFHLCTASGAQRDARGRGQAGPAPGAMFSCRSPWQRRASCLFTACCFITSERRLSLPKEGSQGSRLFTRCSCPKVASAMPSGTAGLCHAHSPADPTQCLGSRGCSKGTGLPSRPGGHREALEAHRLQLSLT